MSDEARALAERRIEVANERLAVAKQLQRGGFYRDAVNRAYYAAFAAARALLALKRLDSKTHQGVINLFYKHYVKPGYFPKTTGAFLEKARGLREKADYDEFAPITAEKTREEVKGAAAFVAAVEKYLVETIRLKESEE
jgi:uncharacterized protein (UPF0332 family)